MDFVFYWDYWAPVIVKEEAFITFHIISFFNHVGTSWFFFSILKKHFLLLI